MNGTLYIVPTFCFLHAGKTSGSCCINGVFVEPQRYNTAGGHSHSLKRIKTVRTEDCINSSLNEKDDLLDLHLTYIAFHDHQLQYSENVYMYIYIYIYASYQTPSHIASIIPTGLGGRNLAETIWRRRHHQPRVSRWVCL